MRALLLHQNFPAQFVHVALALKARGEDVRAIMDGGNRNPAIVPTTYYRAPPDLRISGPAGHFGAQVARGEVVARAMVDLRGTGFTPTLSLVIWDGTKRCSPRYLSRGEDRAPRRIP